MDPHQPCWASESQCGHHCSIPRAHTSSSAGTGQPDQSAEEAQPKLQKATSGPCLWLDILSSATCLLLSRLCPSTTSRPRVKPFSQQTHSVLEVHLVPTYFWDVEALGWAGCEVQKDTGTLTVERSRPGRVLAASSSLPGNAHTEVHSHCCVGPNAV